jgi:hypothetical protein
MTRLPAEITGRWRISSMDLWAQDAVELDGPGFVELKRDGLGEMHFIAVDVGLDCEPSVRDGKPMVEFTFEGTDEGDARSGRGWLRLIEPDELEGHLWFHLGDKSGVRATRWSVGKPARRPLAARRRRTTG